MNQDLRDNSLTSMFGPLLDFSFSTFIALNIIKIIYILGLVGLAIGWLVLVVTGFTQGFLAGVGVMITASIMIPIGWIFWRVYLELIIVIFRIAENTTTITRHFENPAPTGGFPVEPAAPAAPATPPGA